MAWRRRATATIPVSYWGRYAPLAVRYGSLRKLLNAVRAWIHYLAGSQRVGSRPCFLKVEISRKCDVNCRYCTVPKDDRFFPWDRYRDLIDALAADLFGVSLYDIGEPLTHPDVLRYIRYAHERRVGTVISTSLSVRRPESFWEQLVCSGLDRMIVAVDGVTADVYRQYRRNGNFALVMDNLQTVLQLRRRHKSPLHIEWQMLDLPWNRRQQDIAGYTARRMGCDSFRIIPESVRRRSRYARQPVQRKRNCLLPFVVFIVDAYGRVRPCYKIYSADQYVGDLNVQSLQAVWNGDAIGRIRDKRLIRERPGCRTCRE